jgi:LysM repeat protein
MPVNFPAPQLMVESSPSAPLSVSSSAAQPSATLLALPPATATRNATLLPALKYTVQEGDWIYKIARQFKVHPDAIIAANPGTDPNHLVAGQVLTIPAAANAAVLVNVTSSPTAVQPTRLHRRANPTATAPAPTAKSAGISPKLAAVKSPAQRYFPPPSWILGPIQGTAEDEKYITDLFYYLDQHNIPITAFHFDSDNWQTCANNAEFKWSEALIGRFRVHNPPVALSFGFCR